MRRLFDAGRETKFAMAGFPMSRLLIIFFCILFSSGCVDYQGSSEEVSFVSADGTTLRGTLVFPETAGSERLPAIILLHGAERAERTRFVYPMLANVFLRRGFAVLVYDKRGAGESGGNFETNTFEQLIADAVAAIALLRRRDNIDPARIGLFGASQSGWYTPEIAARAGDIAFIINKVGPAISWRENVAWEVYNDFRADGIGAESAREQTEIVRRIWNYQLAPNEAERIALEQVLAAWATREDSGLPVELEPASPVEAAIMRYDPAPFLESLSVPILYLYGSEDINVPAEENVARLQRLQSLGRPVAYHVFEGGDHELATIGWLPPWYRFLDGYADMVGEFALRHAGGGAG